MGEKRQRGSGGGEDKADSQPLQPRTTARSDTPGLHHTGDTHPAAEMLSGLWRELEPDLRRTLRRWMPPADVDDAVQEVFIRLERRLRRASLEPDSVRDLARLAAVNLGKNAVRNAQRRADAIERAARLEWVHERAAASAEAEATARLDLATVIRAIRELSEADQHAISRALAAGETPHAKRDRDRLLLQLFRARRRLRAKLSATLAAFPIWRLRPWHSDFVHVVGSAGAAVVVAAALGVLARAPQSDFASRTDRPIAAVPSSLTFGTERSAGRHASQPSLTDVRPVSGPTRETPSEEPPTQRQLAAVPHPAGGDAATLHGSDRGERPNLACIGGGPLGELVVCVPHPLR